MTQDEIIETGVKAALKLAETGKWGDLTLAQIAGEAGLSLKDFHGVADKDDLSATVEKIFDAGMSEEPVDADETARTRLFDVIMLRFEAMEEVRDGAMSYLRWRDRSLDGLALRLKARAQTAKWALACAGLDGASAIPRGVQVAALGWAISQAERAWRQETSADLSRTMAALDAELIKIEERAAWVKNRGRKPKSDAPVDEDA
ncbi:MAG: TetR family transcriptional regulator [Henriciella sp.]